jgi:hypothetical protein
MAATPRLSLSKSGVQQPSAPGPNSAPNPISKIASGWTNSPQNAALRTGLRPSTLQRRIVVNEEHKWVEEQLHKMVDYYGTYATVIVKEDGTVALIASDDSSPGVKLLTRLIESPQTIQISLQHELDKGATSSLDNLADGSNGTGTGSHIRMTKGTQKSLVLREGELVEENTPAWLILGHELIHAERAARGAKVKRGEMADYEVKGKWSKEDVSFKHMASREETETVGLTPGNDITENLIRSYHRFSPVAMYEKDYVGAIERLHKPHASASGTGKKLPKDMLW